VIEITMGFENVPVGLTNSVPTFSIVDGGKVKRSMDECGMVHAWVGQKLLNCFIFKSFSLSVIAS
jgi:hypothetical protein